MQPQSPGQAGRISEEQANSIIQKEAPRQQRLTQEASRLGAIADQAVARLVELKQKAKAEFGTDDPAEISKLIEEREKKNYENLTAYQRDLETKEQQIAADRKILVPSA
jgi:uncharacterized protein YfcZ (UPF0381/DUF406 family)